MNSYRLDKGELITIKNVLKKFKGKGGYIRTSDKGNSFTRIYTGMKNKIQKKIMWWSGIEFHNYEDGTYVGFMIKSTDDKLLKATKQKFKDFEVEQYINNDPERNDNYIWGHKKLSEIVESDNLQDSIKKFFEEVVKRCGEL